GAVAFRFEQPGEEILLITGIRGSDLGALRRGPVEQAAEQAGLLHRGGFHAGLGILTWATKRRARHVWADRRRMQAAGVVQERLGFFQLGGGDAGPAPLAAPA